MCDKGGERRSWYNISLNSFVNITVKHGYNTRIYINFTASITDGEPHIVSKNEQSLRKEDIVEVKWFTRDELKNMKEEEFINDVVREGEVYRTVRIM